AGMAVRAGIAVRNAIELIGDRGTLGFKSLYERSKLPAELYRAFRAAVDVIAELRDAGHEAWVPAHTQMILDRVMKEYDEACPAGLEFLLSQMSNRILGRSDQQGRS